MNLPFPPVRDPARPLPALVLLAAVVVAGPATAEPLRYEEGLARAPGGGALLYREQHWLRLREGRPLERLVLYRCPNGVAFARKQVDYRGSAPAPAFALEDARSGYREGLRRTGPRTVLYWPFLSSAATFLGSVLFAFLAASTQAWIAA